MPLILASFKFFVNNGKVVKVDGFKKYYTIE
jgi:hypothetical protein